jgi:cytochrome d ubiquinol oxidase subunit I
MVYGLLTVHEGISANTTAEVFVGLVGLWAVYLGLIGLDIYLLRATAKAGIHRKPDAQLVSAPAPDYAGSGFQDYDRRN